MKVRDVIDPMLELLYDAQEAENLISEKDSQFSRRAYIRSCFAYIEGSVWQLKQLCLRAKPSQGRRSIKISDYALLAEENYELKGSGESYSQTKIFKLQDNLKFTIRVYNELFGAKIDLGVGKSDWNKFLDVIKIRNRITHPKNIKEYQISDLEKKVCVEVVSWFNGIVEESVTHIGKISEKAQEAIRGKIEISADLDSERE